MAEKTNTKNNAGKPGMNKEIGGRAPRKSQINLVKKEVQTVDVGRRIVVVVALLAVLLALGGYTYMRWQTVKSLARQTIQLSEELAGMKLISATYDDIYAEYIRFSTGYESVAESRTQDSRLLVDKVRERIEPYGFITSINMDGNSMEIEVYCEDVAKIVESLNNDPDGLIVMVKPISEIRRDSAQVSGVEVYEGEPGETAEETEGIDTETGEETGEETGGLQFEFYSKELGTRVLVESINTFTLIFADKEG